MYVYVYNLYGMLNRKMDANCWGGKIQIQHQILIISAIQKVCDNGN